MRGFLVGLLLLAAACSEDSGGGGDMDTGAVQLPPGTNGGTTTPAPTPPPVTDTSTTPTAPPADTTPMDTTPATDPVQPAQPGDPAGDDPAMMGTAGMMGTEVPMSTGPLTFSSAEFTDGAMIPGRFRCDAPSPALSWSGGPAETMSYAIVVTDLGLNLLHWVIYDIPATETALPEGVPEGAMPTMPAGAKQAPADSLVASTAATGAMRYIGPCAPFGTSMYEFKLYALGEAALSTAGTTGAEVKTALESSALESTTLTISSMP